MAKVIVKKKMGRPKGAKDKIAKKQKIKRQIRKIEQIKQPPLPLTETTLEQQIAALQKELEQRKMKANVGWTNWGALDYLLDPPNWLDPPKPRGRPRRHVEASQQALDESQVPEVEKTREDQPETLEMVINKPSEIKKGQGLRDLVDCDGNHLFNGSEPRSPGRPKGSKNKITLVLEKIGDDNAAEVYQKMVDLALGRSSEGDAYACKFILDRVYPQRKGRKFTVEMRGPVDTPNDINEFSKKVLNLLAEGEISAEEAVDYGRVFEQSMKTMTDTEVVKKIESTCQKVEDIKNGKYNS
jgi:hypothetical protein